MQRTAFFMFATTAVYATSVFGRTANPLINNVKTIVGSGDAIASGAQLGGFTYIPAVGANGPAIYTYFNGGIRKVESFDTATPTSTQMLNKTPWTTWQQDIATNGITGLAGGQPIPQGAAVNPIAIGNIPAYSMALVSDIPTTVTKNSVPQYNAMKRLYSYNLQQATPNLTDDMSAYSVLTPKMTAADEFAASGVTPNTGGAILSQPAFSYDGTHAYVIDGSTAAAVTGNRGIYRVDLVNGGTQRIMADTGRARFDLAVSKVDDSTDRFYLPGTASIGNVAGLSAANYNTQTNTFGSWDTLVSQSTLRTFLNGDASTTYNIDGVVPDGSNLYFAVSGGVTGTTARGAILRLDDQGRLSKVISYAERRTGFGTTMISPTKFQIRDATYAAPDGSTSTRRELMYSDTGNYVGGVFIFDAGDFNHDGSVDAADAALFRTPGVIGLRGSTTSDASKFVFDMNANVAAVTSSTATVVQSVGIDYTDVKEFQKFYAFPDGDSNFDKTVNFDDLIPLAQNYNQTGKVWTQGDFDGDAAGTVNFDDLIILAQHYNTSTLPSASQLLSLGSDFAADFALARALVPEPTSLAVLSVAGLVVSRRRR